MDGFIQSVGGQTRTKWLSLPWGRENVSCVTALELGASAWDWNWNISSSWVLSLLTHISMYPHTHPIGSAFWMTNTLGNPLDNSFWFLMGIALHTIFIILCYICYVVIILYYINVCTYILSLTFSLSLPPHISHVMRNCYLMEVGCASEQCGDRKRMKKRLLWICAVAYGIH